MSYQDGAYIFVQHGTEKYPAVVSWQSSMVVLVHLKQVFFKVYIESWKYSYISIINAFLPAKFNSLENLVSVLTCFCSFCCLKEMHLFVAESAQWDFNKVRNLSFGSIECNKNFIADQFWFDLLNLTILCKSKGYIQQLSFSYRIYQISWIKLSS